MQKITSNQGDFNQLKNTFQARPTTFRINTLKADPKLVIEDLKREGFKLTKVAWADLAYILQNKSQRELMKTLSYQEGQIYLQSLASQVPPLVLDPKPGETVLDLTAAPGSKTTQIAALMDQTGQLTAIELNEPRYNKLIHNLQHLGLREDFVKANNIDGAYFAKKHPQQFDKILLDAPCSAEARFCANKSTTYSYWSLKTVREMKSKQWRLLKAAWEALKPGGILVYSTCTLAPEENEVQIHKMLNEFTDCQVEAIHLKGLAKMPAVQVWDEENLNSEISKTLRIRPTKEIESFFIARLKKLSSEN